LEALAGTCLRVLAAGGSVDFVDSASSPAVLDLLARRRATDLVAAAPVLTAVRRRIEAEVAVSPIHILAVFEALQHDPARPPADRRRLLAGALLADRDIQLVRLHSCGTPLEPETVCFFVRMGMAVLASPAKRAGPA
jgi:hypothetical protein